MLMEEILEENNGSRLLINGNVITPPLLGFEEVEKNYFSLNFAKGVSAKIHASWSVIVPTREQEEAADRAAEEELRLEIANTETQIKNTKALLGALEEKLSAVRENGPRSLIHYSF